MATYVGAEYAIAHTFIALNKLHHDLSITISDLCDICNKLQYEYKNLCDTQDVLFLFSIEQIYNALYDYSDYFAFSKETNVIMLKSDKDIRDLNARFMGYLPFSVVYFLSEMCFKLLSPQNHTQQKTVHYTK